jgi:hypothetical protein
MATFVGWWAVGAGFRLPGELSHGLNFDSIPSKGLEAWDAVPGWGKAQMLIFAGLIEFHDELFHSRRGEGGHYLRGGTPGKVSLHNMIYNIVEPGNFASNIVKIFIELKLKLCRYNYSNTTFSFITSHLS